MKEPARLHCPWNSSGENTGCIDIPQKSLRNTQIYSEVFFFFNIYFVCARPSLLGKLLSSCSVGLLIVVASLVEHRL